MEIVPLPRVSALLADIDIFTDLTRFSTTTGFTPVATGVTKIESPMKLQKAKPSKLARFIGTFTNRMVLKGRHRYENFTGSEFTDSLFDTDIHMTWTKDKDGIKNLTVVHERFMVQLKNAQERCWRSKSKMLKYGLMMHTQVSFLSANPDLEDVISAEIKKVQRCYKKISKQHDKDYQQYMDILQKEKDCREKLVKTSRSLKDDMVDKMTAAINHLLEATNQRASSEEIQWMAAYILQNNTKIYYSKLPTGVPCDKERVELARMIRSKNAEKKKPP